MHYAKIAISQIDKETSPCDDLDANIITSFVNSYTNGNVVPPITVRQYRVDKEASLEYYELVFGRHRLLALRSLTNTEKFSSTHCKIVQDMKEDELYILSVKEDKHKLVSDRYQQMEICARLYTEYGRDITEISRIIEISETTIAAYIKAYSYINPTLHSRLLNPTDVSDLSLTMCNKYLVHFDQDIQEQILEAVKPLINDEKVRRFKEFARQYPNKYRENLTILRLRNRKLKKVKKVNEICTEIEGSDIVITHNGKSVSIPLKSAKDLLESLKQLVIDD